MNLGPCVNSSLNEDGPTYFEDENGAVTLYFTSFQRPGGLGDWDIYASQSTGDDHRSFGPATLVTELSSPRRDTRTSIRHDGLEMFITSNRAGSIPDALGVPSLDIWVSTRASTADPWSTPVNLGTSINTAAADGAPSLSFDGLTLYFDSTRAGGSRDLQVSTRDKLKGGDDTVSAGALTHGAAAPGLHALASRGELLLAVADQFFADDLLSDKKHGRSW